jgi:hypothetical protein
MALPDALTGHFHEAQVTHRKCFRARAVAAEMHAQLLENTVSGLTGFHVDEITNDDPANVAQA